jgi:AraC family ethanolamine operon transcriptional activator
MISIGYRVDTLLCQRLPPVLSPAMSEAPVPSVADHTLTDPDELESLFNRQQDFHVMQLDLQPLQCHLLHLKLDGAVFAFRQLTSPLRVRGEKQPGILTFEFLLSPPSGELISHGCSIQPYTLYGFDSNRAIDMVTPANTLLGTLLIQRPIFEDCLHIMDRTDLDDRFFATNAVQSPAAFAPVTQYLRELFSLAQQRSGILHRPEISQLILDDYLPLLIESIPPMGSQSPKANGPRSRVQLVQQAEDYMLANLDQPITLKDLCKILNTSSSPLSYGFKEVFGLGPMAYLKRLRLHAAHKVLKTADPGVTTVQDVAHQFGFWHTGRFGQEYKQMFGELPSASLKAKVPGSWSRL